jgi:uncharacterized small protein (DUF1192 family)
MTETSELKSDSLSSRVDRVEQEMIREGSLEMAAFRRLLHGLTNDDIDDDADLIMKVDEIIGRINRLESEMERQRAQLSAQRNQQKGMKKARAKRLVRNEVLRQIDSGTNPIGEGGAVEVPKVIDMGHGIGVELTHKTVDDAFRALADEWDCFEFQHGSGTKEGANKRLVATNDAIAEALWEIYQAETGKEAKRPATSVESSERSNGGH